MKYTISFSQKQEERLEELAKRLNLSKAEVVRRALQLLGAIAREIDSPDKAVQIVDKKNETTKELITFLDDV